MAKLATRVTRARGIASRTATGTANPRKRAKTRRPVGGRTVRASRGTLVAAKGRKGGKSGS